MSTKISVAIDDIVYVGYVKFDENIKGVCVYGLMEPVGSASPGMKEYLRSNEIKGVVWEEPTEQ